MGSTAGTVFEAQRREFEEPSNLHVHLTPARSPSGWSPFVPPEAQHNIQVHDMFVWQPRDEAKRPDDATQWGTAHISAYAVVDDSCMTEAVGEETCRHMQMHIHLAQDAQIEQVPSHGAFGSVSHLDRNSEPPPDAAAATPRTFIPQDEYSPNTPVAGSATCAVGSGRTGQVVPAPHPTVFVPPLHFDLPYMQTPAPTYSTTPGGKAVEAHAVVSAPLSAVRAPFYVSQSQAKDAVVRVGGPWCEGMDSSAQKQQETERSWPGAIKVNVLVLALCLLLVGATFTVVVLSGVW